MSTVFVVCVEGKGKGNMPQSKGTREETGRPIIEGLYLRKGLVYICSRDKEGFCKCVRRDGVDAEEEPIDPCHDIINHSPDGYNWGYAGSGPAQLALAICFDYLREKEKAFRVYQELKAQIIAGVPQETEYWELTGEQLFDFFGGNLEDAMIDIPVFSPEDI